jgi:hypothetical protein
VLDHFVTFTSACGSTDVPCEVVDGDHVSIVKPNNTDHRSYVALKNIARKPVQSSHCACIPHKGLELVGTWWQFAIGKGGDVERAAVSFMKISCTDDGSLTLAGRSWSSEGTLLAKYQSQASSLKEDGLFYYWEGFWPDGKTTARTFSGKGQIIYPASKDRTSGYFTTTPDRPKSLSGIGEKTITEYIRAQPEDSAALEGSDEKQRTSLIMQRLRQREEMMRH